MSQMPVQINPAAPAPSAKGSGSEASSAKGGSGGFDRLLQQAASGSGQTANGGGEGAVRLEGARQAGAPPNAGIPRDGKPVTGGPGGEQRSAIARQLAQLGLKGDQLAGEGEGGDRLLATIRDLLGQARPGGQGRGEAGQTVLDLLAQFRGGDGEAKLAELLRADNGLGQSEKAARFAAILSQMGGGDGTESGKGAEGATSLSALSVGGLSVLSDPKTGSTGLTLGQSQNGGKQGLDSLANLLTGQLQGQGSSAARGEGEAGKGLATTESSTRDSGNRLAGSELNGREASSRGDASLNSQGSPSRTPSAASAPRVVQGQQTASQAMVQVAKEAADGQRDVRLQLNPPNLGQVRVELQMSDNRVQAIFHVDNRHAAGLLDGQMSTLRNALQDQQLDLEDAQVQLSNPDSGEGESNPWGQDDEGRQGPWTAWGQGDGAEEDGATHSGPQIEGGLSLYA